MVEVRCKPLSKNRTDTTIPARGPTKAKSNMDFEFGGGDLRGVMAPVKPVVIDGTIVGKPTSN